MLKLDEILGNIQAYAPDARLEAVRKAWVFAQKYHRGQLRKSGEPFFAHPLEVANLLAGLRMDTDTIVAAILHDTVEDTDATLEEIETAFGVDVARMVEGVTKLDKLQFRTAEDFQAENFRKLVFAMSKDIRVIVIKLADRLHNMRTLGSMKPEKQARIARETMDLYAPIANRLGIVQIKGELEDLSFQYLYPEAWKGLRQHLDAMGSSLARYIQKVSQRIEVVLEGQGFVDYEVKGRVKRLWSIWQKMQEKELPFEEVHDLLAFRILVKDMTACYGALGAVHGQWAPVTARFKDYIAQPKANGYRSLHTTVVGPDGHYIEVQIRSHEMHASCELGIAAHWKYKEGRLALRQEEIEKFTKVRQLLQWAEDIEDGRDFIDVLKVDLWADEVYVRTPRGEVRWFPRGVTPLDFAYSIHTEVGHHCTGAKIDGRLVKLNYKLRSGDKVEIITRPEQQPSRDWLDIVVTSRARNKIRQHLRKAERERAIETGRALLDQELRKYGRSLKSVLKQDKLKAALDDGPHKRTDELFAAIGFGKYDVEKVLPLYIAEERLGHPQPKPEESNRFTGLIKRLSRRQASPVRVDGLDGMLTIIARCCRPLPGDPIIGFTTRGRGITVHHAQCSQGLALPPERRVHVEWTVGHGGLHAARIRVTTLDRPGILAEITRVVGQNDINITKIDAHTSSDDRGYVQLEVAVDNASKLTKLLNDLTRLKGIISAERVGQGAH